MNSGFAQRLNDFCQELYHDILEKLQFEFSQKQDGPGMGALIEFVGHNMVFRIVNDRDQFFISISNKSGKREWWDIEFILAYLKLKDNEVSDLNTRKRILCETFKWDNYIENASCFLIQFDQIKKLFLPDDFVNTRIDLNKVRKESGKYNIEKMNNARK
ncbi:MAG: hypothetical protein AB9834_05785 [Lentimicrobium sp.]